MTTLHTIYVDRGSWDDWQQNAVGSFIDKEEAEKLLQKLKDQAMALQNKYSVEEQFSLDLQVNDYFQSTCTDPDREMPLGIQDYYNWKYRDDALDWNPDSFHIQTTELNILYNPFEKQ